MVGPATDATAELVQLGEAEALGVEDDHHGGVGDVDADFDDGRGDEDLGFAGDETLHLGFFLFGFHFSMYFAHSHAREDGFEGFVAFFEVFEIAFLTFFDEGIDDVDLSALGNLLPNAGVEAGGLVIVFVKGLDGFAAGRKLVDDADVEVAVEGHGQRSRNGCGGHHEYVRRGGTFLPEFGALLDAETMLFVDDGQSETGELNAVFDQGVGADENVYLSGNEVGEQGLPLFAFNNSGEQLGTHAAAGKHLADGDKMLLGEDFGGGHQAGLKSIVYGNEHRHEGDEGFA